MRQITVEINGKPTEVDQLDFEPEGEPFSSYRLEDGTRLRCKSVVTVVYRHFTAEGVPQYGVQAASIVAADVPPQARRPTRVE